MSRRIGYRAKKAIPAEVLAAQDAEQVAVEQAISFAANAATDSARKLAAEHNINLADLTGTGVGGRITKGDVEAAVSAGGNPETTVEHETATGGEQ